MSETCKVSSERRGDVAILWTDGYINNQGGEEIARRPTSIWIRGPARSS